MSKIYLFTLIVLIFSQPVIAQDMMGCTDPLAPEYDPMATIDDGTCYTSMTLGCIDPMAHNYDPIALMDDGTCMTCNDLIQNGDETGIDCGGTLCEPCDNNCGELIDLPSFTTSVDCIDNEVILNVAYTGSGTSGAKFFYDIDAIYFGEIELANPLPNAGESILNINLAQDPYGIAGYDFLFNVQNCDNYDLYHSETLSSIECTSYCNSLSGLFISESITCSDSVMSYAALTLEFQIDTFSFNGKSGDTIYVGWYDALGFYNGLIPVELPDPVAGGFAYVDFLYDGDGDGQININYLDCNDNIIGAATYDIPCESTCSDGIQNGDEEGIDCGGPTCEPCPCDPIVDLQTSASVFCGDEIMNQNWVSLYYDGGGSPGDLVTVELSTSNLGFQTSQEYSLPSSTGSGSTLMGDLSIWEVTMDDSIYIDYRDCTGMIIESQVVIGACESSNCMDQSDLSLDVIANCDDNSYELTVSVIYLGGGTLGSTINMDISSPQFYDNIQVSLLGNAVIGDTIHFYTNPNLEAAFDVNLSYYCDDPSTNYYSYWRLTSPCYDACNDGEIFFVTGYCGMSTEGYVGDPLGVSFLSPLGYGSYFDINVNGFPFDSIESAFDYYMAYDVVGGANFIGVDPATVGRKIVYLYEAGLFGEQCDSPGGAIDSAVIELYERPQYDFQVSCDSFNNPTLVINYTGIGGKPYEEINVNVYDQFNNYLNSVYADYQTGSGSQLIGSLPFSSTTPVINIDTYGPCGPVSDRVTIANPCYDGPTCYDGLQNGDETGVDCGGMNCEPCDVGLCSGDLVWIDPCSGSILPDSFRVNRQAILAYIPHNDFGYDYVNISTLSGFNYGTDTYIDGMYQFDGDVLTQELGSRWAGTHNIILTEVSTANGSCNLNNGILDTLTFTLFDDPYFEPVLTCQDTVNTLELISVDSELHGGFTLSLYDDFGNQYYYGPLVAGPFYIPNSLNGFVNLQISDCGTILYDYLRLPCYTEECFGGVIFTSDSCYIGPQGMYVGSDVQLNLGTNDQGGILYDFTVNGVDYTDVESGYDYYVHVEDTTYVTYVDTIIQDNNGIIDTLIVVDSFPEIFAYYEHIERSFEHDVAGTFGIDLSTPGSHDFTITSIASTDGYCDAVSDTIVSISTLNVYDYPDVDFIHTCNPDGSTTVDLYYAGYGGIPNMYIDGQIIHQGNSIDYLYGNLPTITDSSSIGYFMGSMTYSTLPSGDSITIQLMDYCTGIVYDTYTFYNDCLPEGSICGAEIYVQENCTLRGNNEYLEVYPNSLVEFWIGPLTGSGTTYASVNSFEYPVVNNMLQGTDITEFIDLSEGAIGAPQGLYLDYVYNETEYCDGSGMGTLDSVLVEVVPYPSLYADTQCDQNGTVVIDWYYGGTGGINGDDFAFKVFDQNGFLTREKYGISLPEVLNTDIPELLGSAFMNEYSDTDSFTVQFIVCGNIVYEQSFENTCNSFGNPCDLQLDFDIYCISNGQYQQDIYYRGGGVPGQVVNYSFNALSSGANGGGIITLPDSLPADGTILQSVQHISRVGGEPLFYTVEFCGSRTEQYVFSNPCPVGVCSAEILTGFTCEGFHTDEFYVGEDINFSLHNATGAGPYDAVINGAYYSGLMEGYYEPINGLLGSLPLAPGSYTISIDSLYDQSAGCTFASSVSTRTVTVRDLPLFSYTATCESDNSTTIRLLYQGGGIPNSSFEVQLNMDSDIDHTVQINLPSNTSAIGAALYEFNLTMGVDEPYTIEVNHPCLGQVAQYFDMNTCLIGGCTDVNAHNYDPRANTSDGSCETCGDGILNGDETGIDCGGILCAPCQPAHDFYITNEAVSSTSPTAGDQITLSATINYIGESASTIYPSLGYYLSDDGQVSLDDILLGTDAAGLSLNNSSSNESVIVEIPEDLSGQYFVLFVANYDDAFVETDSTNNIESIIINVAAAPQGDDFIIIDADLSAVQLEAGETIIASCDQAYVGNSSTTLFPRVGFYYSIDDIWDADDIELGDSGSTLSKSDTDDPESASVMIPMDAGEGSAYILFVADHEESYGEVDEDNNVTALPITVEETDITLPDFYTANAEITYNGALTTQLTIGEEYRLSVDQNYIGNSPDRIWVDLGYYLSDDPNFDPDDDTYLGRDPSSLKFDDLNDPERLDYTVPSFISPGDYYILFVADHIFEYEELSEANNVTVVPVSISDALTMEVPSVEVLTLQTLPIHIPMVTIASPQLDESDLGIISGDIRTVDPIDTYKLSTIQSDDITVYPNPSIGEVNVLWSSTDGGMAELHIYDALGRLIIENTLNSNISKGFDLSHQPRGTYHITIKFGSGIVNKKFILIR